jgi:hypothetical protein
MISDHCAPARLGGLGMGPPPSFASSSVTKNWKSGQRDNWIFCMIVANMATPILGEKGLMLAGSLQ